MLSHLTQAQRWAAYGAIAISGLCFWSYLSSAIFFNLVGLPESDLKPWSIIEYHQAYRDNASVVKKVWIAVFIPLSLIAALLLLSLIKTQSLFGEARFAKQHEVSNARFMAGKGIVLGKRNGKFISDDGTEHVLVAAPTRSGKGVGLVIPNMLNWDGSLVVLDIKLENFQASSGFRRECGHETFLFNPADPEGITHRYNPLGVISESPILRINDIQQVANFLAPDPLQGDPMWAAESRKLFLATVLFLQDTGAKLTLGNAYRFINGNSAKDINELLAEHSDNLDPACLSNFFNYTSMGEKQRSGVKSTLTSSLDLFDNPLIDAATSDSDFSFTDLRKKRISIYVGVTPNNLKRLKPLLNLFFQQCIDQNTQSLPDKTTEPHKILMLMDEFTSLGRMDIIKTGIAFFAGYHIRLMPIIQGPAQLGDTYGHDGKRSMISNFKFRVVFAPNDMRDAEDISKELGNKTVNQKSRNQNTWNAQSGSTTTSKTARALLLPQEVKLLDRKKEIILVEAMAPIMADKIIYYTDKAFSGRFFNVFDPASNTGPLPINITPLDLTSAMEARKSNQACAEINSKLEERSAQPTEENTVTTDTTRGDLFDGPNKLEGIGKESKPGVLANKPLSEGELSTLLDEFWNSSNTPA